MRDTPHEYRMPHTGGHMSRVLHNGTIVAALVIALAVVPATLFAIDWPVYFGWGGLVIVILITMQELHYLRLLQRYANTTWRLTDRWVEMESPDALIRITRHNVDGIYPAPDGVIVRRGDTIITVPDVVEGYEELRAHLMHWMPVSIGERVST